MILSFAAEEHEERSGLWMLVCFSHLSVSFSLSSGFFYLFFLLWVCFLCLSKPGYWLAVCFLSASSRCEAQQLTATGFYHPKVAWGGSGWTWDMPAVWGTCPALPPSTSSAKPAGGSKALGKLRQEASSPCSELALRFFRACKAHGNCKRLDYGKSITVKPAERQTEVKHLQKLLWQQQNILLLTESWDFRTAHVHEKC